MTKRERDKLLKLSADNPDSLNVFTSDYETDQVILWYRDESGHWGDLSFARICESLAYDNTDGPR